jgi:hypothetical protein
MRWSGAVAGALALAALLVVSIPTGPSSHRVALSNIDTAALQELVPRGASRPGVSYVGIRVFQVMSKKVGFRETPGVDIDDVITFTYTYTKGEAGYLMVFGLQEAALPLWYYPDYGDERSIPIRGDRVDEPLGDGIVLSVNHKAGRLRIVSLFSEMPIHREAVEAAVERLRQGGRLLDENAPLALDDGGKEAIEYSIVLRIGGSNDGE